MKIEQLIGEQTYH